MISRVKPGRYRTPSRTHCSQNHPLEGENLIVHKDGKRICRLCQRAKNLERRRTPDFQERIVVVCWRCGLTKALSEDSLVQRRIDDPNWEQWDYCCQPCRGELRLDLTPAPEHFLYWTERFTMDEIRVMGSSLGPLDWLAI